MSKKVKGAESLSPARRRVPVAQLMLAIEVSRRRVCAVVCKLSSTQRSLRSAPKQPEQQSWARLRQLAQEYPRYEYRRLHALLTGEGHLTRRTFGRRLRSGKSFRMLVSGRKRARLVGYTVPGDRLLAAFPNHKWGLDFAFDPTTDAQVLKVLMNTNRATNTALASKSSDRSPAMTWCVSLSCSPTCNCIRSSSAWLTALR